VTPTEGTVTATAHHEASAAEPDEVTYDTSVPSPARVWNYWIGGKDNYAADRAAAHAVMAANPVQPAIARTARRFLVDAVQQLAGQHGVRQFLDIGSGLPTADNTHEVAQRVAPDCRVVYVDNDPVVLAHARALLTSTSEGRTDFILADLRDPETILTQAGGTLDFSQPVAIVLLGVLHFIDEDADPYALVSRLMGPVAVGSYLVIGHAASDVRSAEVQEGYRAYNERSPVKITPRNRQQIDRLLVGLEPVGPGVVTLGQWFEAGQLGGDGADLVGYTGIMRKPR
jgi:O-methyltransferase involved in polyketide biosynthesis